jgi:hypothetical protein
LWIIKEKKKQKKKSSSNSSFSIIILKANLKDGEGWPGIDQHRSQRQFEMHPWSLSNFSPKSVSL